jgi:glycosyltransferase involved in cell wall biosynthesis
MNRISAVIVAHNEEKKIEDCLKSLNFADEIVVVLDKCTDSTKQIVQKYTDKTIEGSWNIEGARRNVALNAAAGEWILEIDADERISKELAEEILALRNEKPAAYIVVVDNYIGKRCVKHGWLRILGVLQRQTLTYKGLKKYHEDKEIHPTFDLKAEINYLKNPLIHLVDDDITDLLNRFNRYTNWRANDLIARGKFKKTGFFAIIFAVKLRILKSYFGKKGYKEGLLGVLLAVLSGLYPLVSYLKAQDKISKNENR